MFIKLAPAARPIWLLNLWPCFVVRGWRLWTKAGLWWFVVVIDHQQARFRDVAARRLRGFTAPAGTVRGPFFFLGSPAYRVNLRRFRTRLRDFRAADRGFRHGRMGHVFDK